MKDIAQMKLGKTDVSLHFEYPDDNRILAHSLVSQARNTVDIFTHDLEPVIYDTREFISALTQLAMHSQHSKIRVLIQDPSRCIREGHRMLELGQRLSSYIELRKPGYDHKNFNEAFLIADNTGLLHKHLSDHYEGVVNFNAPLEAGEKTKFFIDAWETAEIDPNLRRIYL